MKKMLFPALATLLLITGACTQKSEYTNSLPADIEALVALQPATLAEKAGAGDKENQALLQNLKDALKKEMDAATYEYAEQLLDNPGKAGIDLESPLYLFTSKTLPQGALVARVADKNSVENLVGNLQKEGIISQSGEAEGYTLAEGKLTMAYNASTLFVLGQQPTPALQDSLQAWMSQGAEQSFSQAPEFIQMQAQKGDIKLLYPYGGLLAEYQKFMGNPMLKNKDFLKDLQITVGLSFEKGRIDLSATPYTDNEEAKALMEKQAQAARPIKNTYIDYFPQSTLFLISSGMDGSASYDILMANTPLGEELSAKDAEYIKRLFGMFQDDFTLGLVNLTLNRLPSLLAYASVNDASPLKELADNAFLKKQLGRGSSIVELEADQYVLRTRQFNLFFGVRDGNFYATNDETLYKDILKKCDPSAAKTSFASEMKGKKASCVLNVEAICQLPIVKMLAGFGGSKNAVYFAALDNISYLKGESDGQTALISLQMKDQNSNALKQLAELCKAALQ